MKSSSTALLFALLFSQPLLYAQDTTVTTLAAPGSNVDDALLPGPDGILYGSNYDGDAVWKIYPDGTVESFADGFVTPNGLAWLGDDLIVVDNQGNGIYKVAPDGTKTFWVGMTSPSGIIREPDSDTLIVTQYGPDRIQKLSPDGVVSPWLEGGLLNGPVGLTYDGEGHLLIGNFTDRDVIRVNGDEMELIGTYPGPSSLGFITYANGCIYGTGFGSHKIWCMDDTGGTVAVAGTFLGITDGHIDSARFNRPNGIIASSTGDSLWISDYGPKSVRILSGLRPLQSTLTTDPGSFSASLFAAPNPFDRTLRVGIELAKSSPVSLEIWDLEGRLVRTVTQGHMAAGPHSFDLGPEIPAGQYLVRLQTDSGSRTLSVIRR